MKNPLVARFGMILTLVAGLLAFPWAARADSFGLGDAGMFAVLGLAGTSAQLDTVNNSLVTITGNEGIGLNGQLMNQAPSTVNGNIYESATGEVSGPGTLNGSLLTDSTLLASANASALLAGTVEAALVPEVSLASVTSATTFTGAGGLNVIDISGNVTNSITLQGSASDIFVVNIGGTASLTGTQSFSVAGGALASNVLFNFTGGGGTCLATHVGDAVNGIVLAPGCSLSLDGTFNGGLIAGGAGANISLLSNAVVNGLEEVPEPGTLPLWAGGLMLLGVVAFRRRFQSIG